VFSKTMHISTSPHITKGVSTDVIMKNVVYALLPLVAFATYTFGISALFVILVTSLCAVLTEHAFCRWAKKPTTIGDWSALITGVLLGLTLPPAFPLWMAMIGGIIAIALGKYAFGGLGSNVFNPALVGRVFLQAAFPVAITTWTPALLADRFTALSSATFTFPFMEPKLDGMTGATPLAAFKFDKISSETQELALGIISGSAGETSALIIVLGGIYLVARQMMNWRIPVSILLTVFVLSGLLYLVDSAEYPSPMFMLFSGGLMLGAVFMASDMVGSPITLVGIWLYGILIGLLVVAIRIWGGQPEGVMYAILLGNAVSPQIDKHIKPRVYGTIKRVKV